MLIKINLEKALKLNSLDTCLKKYVFWKLKNIMGFMGIYKLYEKSKPWSISSTAFRTILKTRHQWRIRHLVEFVKKSNHMLHIIVKRGSFKLIRICEHSSLGALSLRGICEHSSFYFRIIEQIFLRRPWVFYLLDIINRDLPVSFKISKNVEN